MACNRPRRRGRRAPRIRLRRGGAVVAVLLAALTGVGTVRPAAADDSGSGTWWYDTLDIGGLAAAGVTGAGVEVAVVDGGISPGIPLLADAPLDVLTPQTCLDTDDEPTTAAVGSQLSAATSHGTNVTAMIVGGPVPGAPSGIAPDARVSFYATTADDWTSCVRDADGGDLGFAQAVVHAVDDGARILSLSIGTLDAPTRAALAWALHEGVVVVAAIGNFDGDDDTLPMLNGLVAVQAEDSDLQPEGTGTLDGPVSHDHVTVVAPGIGLRMQGDTLTGSWDEVTVGAGTSFAAPLVAGALADLAQRYPQATGNQLIQDLVTTASALENTDPDVVGYGQVNPVGMLQVDPTTLPDINPLIVDEPRTDDDLSAEEIAEATRPDLPDVGWTLVHSARSSAAADASSPSSSGTAAPQATAPASTGPASTGLAVTAPAAAAAAAGVGAVALGAIGLRRRRRRTRPPRR